MTDSFVGQIISFGGRYAIRNFAFCNGKKLKVGQNSALYSILGNIYGGDGIHNYGLPDLRGRSPISQGHGPGLSFHALGQYGGSETAEINRNNLPMASIGLRAQGATEPGTGYVAASSHLPDTPYPDNAQYATFPSKTPVYAKTLTSPDKKLGTLRVESTKCEVKGTTDPLGQGVPIETVPPFLAITWLIAVQGIYPSRS